jgi:hypothetical protein
MIGAKVRQAHSLDQHFRPVRWPEFAVIRHYDTFNNNQHVWFSVGAR